VRRPTALRHFRSALVLIGILFALVAGNDSTTAQDIGQETCFDLGGGCDVEAVAAIAGSTDDVEIDAYADEEIVSFDLLDFGDEAVVNGSLFEDQDVIDENEGDDDGSGFAEVDLSDSINLGSVYTMEGDFYIIDPIDGPEFLGSLFAQVVAAAPEIDDISPPGDQIGASGQLTVNGFDLFDQFNGTVNISPIPGVHWGSSFQASSDGTQITLSYTIDSNATSGDQNFWLETRFGQSNTVTFAIYDPPPVVTQVNPDQWQAGTEVSITVQGQHFGTCGKISVSGPGVTGSSTSGLSTDTQVQGTVTIDPNSQGGPATVTVTSDGENCNGFLGRPGTTNNASNKAQIQPISPTPPKILLDGQDVTGSVQNVVVGQRIALTASITVPGGTQISSESWSGPDPAGTSGGFGNGSGGQPDATGGAELAMPSQTCQTSNPACPFTYYYVVTETSDQVGLSYTLSNQQQASSQVSFKVTGPSGNLKLTANMPTDGSGVKVFLFHGNVALGTTGVPSGGANPVGITFTANATPPSGYNQSFTWAQVISSLQDKYVNANGPFSVPPSPQSGIDHAFPYANASPTTTNDTPNTLLPSIYGEGWRSFTATMYLMWDPALPNGCTPAKIDPHTLVATPSNCTSIPVPLSSVQWHWSGCAINTLAPQAVSTWVLSTTNGCPVQTLDSPQQSPSFPLWTSAVNP